MALPALMTSVGIARWHPLIAKAKAIITAYFIGISYS